MGSFSASRRGFLKSLGVAVAAPYAQGWLDQTVEDPSTEAAVGRELADIESRGPRAFVFEEAKNALCAGALSRGPLVATLVLSGSPARSFEGVRRPLTTHEVVGEGFCLAEAAMERGPGWLAQEGQGPRLFAGNPTWTNLEGDRPIEAVLVSYRDAGVQRPLLYTSSGGFPAMPTGGDLTICWPASGMLILE